MIYQEKTREELLKVVKELEQQNNQLKVSHAAELHKRRLTEETLLRTNDHLQSMLDELPVMLFESDEDGRIYDFRSPHTDMLYGQPERFMGKSVEEILPADASVVIKQSIAEASANGHHKGGCYSLQTPSGLKWFELAISKKLNNNGQEARFLIVVNEISERKSAEESIKATLSLLNSSLESTADGILIVNRVGVMIKWNQKFANMWQLSPDLLSPGKDIFDVDHILSQLTDPVKFVDRVKYLYTNLEESDLNLIRFLDGRIFERYSQPYRIENKVVGRVWSFRDVTESKKAEERSRKLSKAVDQSPSTIVITDLFGNIEYVNPKFTETTGYTFQEAKGNNPRIFKSGNTSDDEYSNLWSIISSGGVWEGEFCNRKKNGEVYWEAAKISPIVGESGVITHYLAIKEDITERKQVAESLRKSEAFNKSIIENEPECVKIIGREGELKYMNPAGLKMIEAGSLEEVIGKSIYHLIIPENRDEFIRLTEEVFQGQSHKLIFEITGLLGTHRWLESSAVPMFDKNGNVESLLSITRDISEYRKAELKIHQQFQELVKVNAEKDKFFSIIAHDLRSPFSGFMGLTDMMCRELPGMSSEELQEISLLLNKSATDLYNLLGNLLEWSMIQRGLTTITLSTFRLFPVISECLIFIFEAARKKDILIDLKIAEDLFVFTDKNILEGIIRNLAINAVKFTPKGGRIIIAASSASDAGVSISITDNGIGMSREMIGNLFRLDVNTRRKGTQGESSTGLGLIICKDLIEKLGGKMMIESEEGKGAAFHFNIQNRSHKD